MLARIAAIAFIFGATSVAWMILGATLSVRTHQLNPGLRSKVTSTWGGPQEQIPPSASVTVEKEESILEDVKGKIIQRTVKKPYTTQLPLEASDIQVSLDLDHRQKGLLWYSTYKAAFEGAYQFRNDMAEDHEVTFTLQYPAKAAIYDDLQLMLDGKALALKQANGCAYGFAAMKPGQVVTLRVGYRTQGLDTWRYRFGDNVSQVKTFAMKMKTNFTEIDFQENSLSPTAKKSVGEGWELEWKYSNLVSGFPIAMQMPQKLQPGPLAGEISYFAPVSLFFFFFVVFLITTLRRIDLHPMNYFFLAAAFFAFHLLLAYLVDHISIHVAFAISSIVSVFLVVSYLQIVVGRQFAWREAAGAQVVYLILFSYAFFFKGYTGLAVTIGAIVTLFIAMQATARVPWTEIFGRRDIRPPAPSIPA